MILDISLVLYRPNIDEFTRTAKSLSCVRDEFRFIHVLVSGSVYLHERINEILKLTVGLDKCKIYIRFDNLGFASGHNFLLDKSFALGSNYCVVLNPDIRVKSGVISDFVRIIEACGDNSLFGPSLERVDEPPADGASRVFDSNGIEWENSARHFDRDMGNLWKIDYGRIFTVQGLTGACLFVKRCVFFDLVKNTGYFFDDTFLAYREDAELGIRAGVFGISSKLIQIDGFGHVRSVRGYERGRSLPDLLGVRNRFLIMIRLGKFRPGNFLSFIRDAAVFFGVFFVEKSSIGGLFSAYRMRRYVKYTSAVRKVK